MTATVRKYDNLPAEKWLARYRSLWAIDRAKPCHNGHSDCSIREGGACMNQVLAENPALDDAA